MKSLFFLTLLAAATAYGQEFRETAVPNAQIGAVLRDVSGWHNMQHPDCMYTKPLGSITVEKEGTKTVEHWSIEACSGKTFTYRVAVFPSPNGGVTDMVSNLDGSAVGNSEPTSPPTVEECARSKARYELLNAKEDVTDAEMDEVPQLAADLAACSSAP